MSINSRVPVVGGLGYIERVRQLPSTVTAALVREPDNRYFPHAIAVTVGGEKVGYVAPEVARNMAGRIAAAGAPPTCPARRALPSDHDTSGVELLLDFSGLALP